MYDTTAIPTPDEIQLAIKRLEQAITHPQSRLEIVHLFLPYLTDEERVEVANLFGEYCMHCGRNDPQCQCWNDE